MNPGERKRQGSKAADDQMAGNSLPPYSDNRKLVPAGGARRGGRGSIPASRVSRHIWDVGGDDRPNRTYTMPFPGVEKYLGVSGNWGIQAYRSQSEDLECF